MLTSDSKPTDNWLNGPTTLNHAEINALVNNITFIIRSLQRNTKSSADIDFSNVHDSDLHIVTAAENGGFRMSIFFGSYLICMGEHVDRREQTMDGLREKVEKMISSIVNVKANAIKKHQHEDSQVTLLDGNLPGSGLVNDSLDSDGSDVGFEDAVVELMKQSDELIAEVEGKKFAEAETQSRKKLLETERFEVRSRKGATCLVEVFEKERGRERGFTMPSRAGRL
ncbi:hypothetical protein SLS60_004301 [Paraconiothyrium brasiliense]|uniref:Uncharacterized protein n=1 Tax=Paraconiothyrium brasiliense TaxID=300254 RepID=A0ABR3RJZ0_9PLEO